MHLSSIVNVSYVDTATGGLGFSVAWDLQLVDTISVCVKVVVILQFWGLALSPVVIFWCELEGEI